MEMDGRIIEEEENQLTILCSPGYEDRRVIIQVKCNALLIYCK
jgi:hypothetical protein